MHNRDVSAIALYALGIEQPEQFVSTVPAELFGESRVKSTEPNPMSAAMRVLRKVLYMFVRLVNLMAELFGR